MDEIQKTQARWALFTAISRQNEQVCYKVIYKSRSIYFLVSTLNVFFFVAVYYIPESPLYLMSKGQEKKAEEALNKLDIDLSVLANLSVKNDAKNAYSLTHFKNPANWKPFLSGIILMAFFQATAYPIMIGNTLTLFREATESIDENIACIIVGIAIVVCALIAIPLAKKCDRKTLLGISALGVCACLFTLGAFYYLKTYADIDGYGWVALVDFMIYIGFFMVRNNNSTLLSKHGPWISNFDLYLFRLFYKRLDDQHEHFKRAGPRIYFTLS